MRLKENKSCYFWRIQALPLKNELCKLRYAQRVMHRLAFIACKSLFLLKANWLQSQPQDDTTKELISTEWQAFCQQPVWPPLKRQRPLPVRTTGICTQELTDVLQILPFKLPLPLGLVHFGLYVIDTEVIHYTEVSSYFRLTQIPGASFTNMV